MSIALLSLQLHRDQSRLPDDPRTSEYFLSVVAPQPVKEQIGSL